MASGDERAGALDSIDGAGLRVALISARWNSIIVERLNEGVFRGLGRLGVADVEHLTVPGCFELPMAAQAVASSGRIDAVICTGAVIRGETTHYELVSTECARGIQHVQLATGVPIAFGVLTVEDHAQALTRSEGPGEHNVGEEAALVAIEMAHLVRDWR